MTAPERDDLHIPPDPPTGPLPVVLFETVVKVCGTSLYWRKSVLRVFRSAGIKQTTIDTYETSGKSKFEVARWALDDLNRSGRRGWIVQRRVVSELANLGHPEDKVPDLAAGQRALDALRKAAQESHLLIDPHELERRRRRAAHARASAERSRRELELQQLHETFEVLRSPAQNKQARGYALERLLAGLFRLEELDYTGSFKTETDQVDGSVVVDAFTYLLEARWRDEVAADAELSTFLNKVERRLDATRGLFISMAGFRPAAVNLYRLSKENKLILMSGEDLSMVLGGRISFADALREKIRAASTRGEPYLQLATLL